MMDMFSLEHEDCNELFITQTSPKYNRESSQNALSILGNGDDFGSPLVMVGSQGEMRSNVAHYEDISDDDFEIPSSQKTELVSR